MEKANTTNREQEKNELYKTIWGIADKLRGAVDGWDFKQYVLGMMFYRYLSENLANYIDNKQKEAGIEDFNYALLDDSKAERAIRIFMNLQSSIGVGILRKW